MVTPAQEMPKFRIKAARTNELLFVESISLLKPNFSTTWQQVILSYTYSSTYNSTFAFFPEAEKNKLVMYCAYQLSQKKETEFCFFMKYLLYPIQHYCSIAYSTLFISPGWGVVSPPMVAVMTLIS